MTADIYTVHLEPSMDNYVRDITDITGNPSHALQNVFNKGLDLEKCLAFQFYRLSPLMENMKDEDGTPLTIYKDQFDGLWRQSVLSPDGREFNQIFWSPKSPAPHGIAPYYGSWRVTAELDILALQLRRLRDPNEFFENLKVSKEPLDRLQKFKELLQAKFVETFPEKQLTYGLRGLSEREAWSVIALASTAQPV